VTAFVAIMVAALTAAGAAAAQDGVPSLDEPLAAPGDPARGRAIVADRQKGLCLLCHTGPIPEERFQGSLAPSLAGAGSRWSRGALRRRLVDPRAFNPDTLMPSYARTEGFTRVGAAWAGRPILAGQDIEDVVAYLAALREPGESQGESP
jgi:sulfur-oxidizing protein SoxX